MSEEWSAGKRGHSELPASDDHATQRLDGSIPGGSGNDAGSINRPDPNMQQAPPRFPPPPGAAGYPPHDPYGQPPHGGLMPPPPIPPEAAAAAAAAGYPPMPPHYQQPHWHPGYGPPAPYGHMYPPYGNPYGPPPHYQPMPPYGYDHQMAAAQHAYGEQMAAGYPQDHDGQNDGDDDDDGDNELEEIGTYGSAARMKMYVKSKVPTRQEILDRRARKNAQSRSRAAKLRERMLELKVKEEPAKSEEEKAVFDQFESRRQRKNDRSRERAIEKKSEIDRILNKPERKRTKIERQFLETALTAKQRKNEGDRLRRQRIKATGRKGQNDTDAQIRPKYSRPEIPLSPLASHQYPQPGSHYPYASSRGPPGASEPSGGGGVPLPFVPPTREQRSQLHLPQHSAQVEQRRHPDGSMSISIGGSRGEEMGDMLLMYGDNAADVDPNQEQGGNEEEDDE